MASFSRGRRFFPLVWMLFLVPFALAPSPSRADVLGEPHPWKSRRGRMGWRLRLPGCQEASAPALLGGKLLFGGGFRSGKFYCVDAASGKTEWTADLDDNGPGPAAADDDVVVCTTESCTIYAFEVSTGRMLWKKWIAQKVLSHPSVGGGRLFVAYEKNGVPWRFAIESYALRTGKKLWTSGLATEAQTAPVLHGKHLYLATVDGDVHKFVAATGACRWTRSCQATSAPRIVGGKLLYSQGVDRQGFREEGVNTLDLVKGFPANDYPRTVCPAPYLLTAHALRRAVRTWCTKGDPGTIMAVACRTLRRLLLPEWRENKLGKGLRTMLGELVGRGVKATLSELHALGDEVDRARAEMMGVCPGIPVETDRELAGLASGLRAHVKISRLRKTKPARAMSWEKSLRVLKRTLTDDFDPLPHTPSLDLTGCYASAARVLGIDGAPNIWAHQGSRPCPVGDGRVVMAQGRRLRCIDMKAGRLVWERRFKASPVYKRHLTPPAFAGGSLYVASRSGAIHSIDPATGKSRWTDAVNSPVRWEPIVGKGRLYLVGTWGDLFCLEIQEPTGSGWPMWGGSPGRNGVR